MELNWLCKIVFINVFLSVWSGVKLFSLVMLIFRESIYMKKLYE